VVGGCTAFQWWLFWTWFSQLVVLLGFNISEGFLIGLAYDREVTRWSSAAFLMMALRGNPRYDLSHVKGKMKSPRFSKVNKIT
jgi:hypothetical protein